MTVSELMQALADAGAPFEAILIAVKAVEEAKAASDVKERGRSKAAERQARYRERNKASQSVICDAQNVTDITGDDERNADPLPLPPNDNNSNPPTPAPVNNTPREAADAHVTDWLAWWDRNPFPRPDWAEARVWADLRKNRKTKKLTNTFTAYAQLLAKVKDLARRTGWPPGEVLEDCVARGWGAVFESDKMKAAINANGNGGNQRSARQSHGGGRDNRDGFKRALDDFIDKAERSAASGDGGPRQLALGGPDTL